MYYYQITQNGAERVYRWLTANARQPQSLGKWIETAHEHAKKTNLQTHITLELNKSQTKTRKVKTLVLNKDDFLTRWQIG